jgi:glutathione S-transferase
VCHYIAEMSAHALLPGAHEKADYFRWLFFAAGPIEAAVTAKSLGFDSGDDPKKQMTVGWGSFDKVVDALDGWFAGHDFVCGHALHDGRRLRRLARSTGGCSSAPCRRATGLDAYAERIRAREAYQAARRSTIALIAEMQAAQPA